MFFNSFVPRFKLEAEGRKESAPFADVVFTRLQGMIYFLSFGVRRLVEAKM